MSVDVYSGAQLSDPDSSPVSSVCPIEAPLSEAHASEAPETCAASSVSVSTDTMRPSADASPTDIPPADVSPTDLPPAPPEHNARRERLAPALALIDAHLAEDLPVARAARTVAMSPSHFRRYFKQVVGQSYVRYVHRRRIDRACELIANTDLSLYQIAIEVGFCDQSYFGLVFRRLLHTTPAAYRRKFRSEPDAPRDTTPPASESGSGNAVVAA
jgi:transcriptional regulator GlxA family with amidase domain